MVLPRGCDLVGLKIGIVRAGIEFLLADNRLLDFLAVGWRMGDDQLSIGEIKLRRTAVVASPWRRRFKLGSMCNCSTPIHGTTLRYRCQVACPSAGMMMRRPTNAGIDPITRPPVTIRPHSAIVSGFLAKAPIDVSTAL